MKRLNVNLLSGLILAIILLGLISAVTVYVNARTYRELAFDFQRQYMTQLVAAESSDILSENAMMARQHMEKYGTTREQLAEVAVKNHFHGSMNSLAQFPQKITVEAVMNSVMIADPLRILDCSPITDGAAALIICPLDLAKKISKKPVVKISGFGHATDTIALHSRADLTDLRATTLAAQQAFKMANTSLDKVDLMEVHDCFTIAEICVLEALGVVEKGKGGEAAASGMTRLGGKLPVNTSGGLKSKGHPVGATGVAQAVEIVTQLRGEAGERQVEKARVGLAQNMGGSGGSTLVHIMEVI